MSINRFNENKDMKKKLVRLTEGDVRRIVDKSIKRILMESNLTRQDVCMEEEIEFNDPDVFGDNEIHIYDCECYDGHAIGRVSDIDENENSPSEIHIEYPTLDEILSNRDATYEVLRYRGLQDWGPEDITYGDIMMKYGKIVG